MGSRPVVDWPFVLMQIRTSGLLSYRQIEELTGVPKWNLMRYRDGAEPRHGDGERLLALWCKVTNNTDPPMQPDFRMSRR